MTAVVQDLPRKRWLMLRLVMLFVAVVLALGLQAGEGEAAGHAEAASKPAPVQRQTNCAPPVALKHPALPAAAQPRDARNNAPSKGCNRAASSGL